MANSRKTKYPGIYVAHSKSCPAFTDVSARCRCKPSWRGRAWDSAAKKAVWSRASKSRGEALAWHAAMTKGSGHLAELAKVGPTFETLGEQWLDGVERGHIGRRRGRGKAYSDTTIEGMRRSWRYRLLPEFGPRFASEITEIDWQRWIDQLARDGLSRSTIAKHVSVASGIYAWASAPTGGWPFTQQPPRKGTAEVGARNASACAGASSLASAHGMDTRLGPTAT